MIKALFLTLFILPLSSAHAFNCASFIKEYLPQEFSKYDYLHSACTLGGGHLEVSTQEKIKACRGFYELKSAVKECNDYSKIKSACDSDGGIWQFVSSNKGWEGKCTPGCADGTTPFNQETHGSHGTATVRCQCPDTGRIDDISPGQDILECGESSKYNQEDCNIYVERGEKTQNYHTCIQNNRVEVQNQKNLKQAKSLGLIKARSAASSDLHQKQNAVYKRLTDQCKSHADNIIVSCNINHAMSYLERARNLSNIHINAGLSYCSSSYGESERLIEEASQESTRCTNIFKSLEDKCPFTTGVLEGRGTVDLGHGHTATEVEYGTRDISANKESLISAKMAFYNSDDKFLECIKVATAKKEDASKCVASFDGDLEENKIAQTDEITTSGSLQTNSFGEPVYNKTKNGLFDENDTLNTESLTQATQLGQSVRALAGRGGEVSSTGSESIDSYNFGRSSNDSAAISNAPFSAAIAKRNKELGLSSPVSNSDDFGDRLLTLNRSNAKINSSSTSLNGRGNVQNNMVVNVNNTTSNGQSGGALASASPKVNVKSISGVDLRTGKRMTTGPFKSSDHRNLLLGFKKVNKFGRSISIHPEDFKKYGEKKLSAMAESYIKKMNPKKGRDLVFNGVSFMTDFLAMQKTKEYQYHYNKMMRKFYKIDIDGVIKSAFHPCVLEYQCYSNPEYNIFKLHTFKVKKLIRKGYFKLD